jgi:hypothetical protein
MHVIRVTAAVVVVVEVVENEHYLEPSFPKFLSTVLIISRNLL